MNNRPNKHIIVGRGNRCICGMYNDRLIMCRDVIAAFEDLVTHSKIKGSGVSLYVSSIQLIDAVLQPLILDCSMEGKK